MERTQDLQQQFQNKDALQVSSHDHKASIKMLRQYRLLKPETYFKCRNHKCIYFGILMSKIINESTVDGFIYRCQKCCSKRCLRTESIFENTFFPLIGFYRCVFIAFIQGMTIRPASEQCDMTQFLTKNIYRYCKSQISFHMQKNVLSKPLCHPLDYANEQPIVEIDESLFTHFRGNYENSQQAQCWVLGIVERKTGYFRCVSIGNQKNEQTIKPIYQGQFELTLREKQQLMARPFIISYLNIILFIMWSFMTHTLEKEKILITIQSLCGVYQREKENLIMAKTLKQMNKFKEPQMRFAGEL